MIVGTIIIGIAMLINIAPIYTAAAAALAANWLPIARCLIMTCR